MLVTMCSMIQLLEYAELFWATEPSLAMLRCNARPAICAWWTPEVQFHDHLLKKISWIFPEMQRMPFSVYKNVLAFIELYYTCWFVCHSPYLIVMSPGGRGLVSAFLFQGLEHCLVHSRLTNDWLNEWHAIYSVAQNLLVFTRLCSFK